MSPSSDPLRELSVSDVVKLRNIYEQRFPYTSHVYNTINVALEWKNKCPNENLAIVYGVDGWKQHGTFVILQQLGGYDLFVYTLEDDCKILYEALRNTKKIDWMQRIVLHAVYEKHFEMVMKALTEVNCSINHVFGCYFWWISKEQAKQFVIECPPEVRLLKLRTEDAPAVNDLWPHNYENSIYLVRGQIELNGGYGIYIKSNNELAASVTRNSMGLLGMLQTNQKYQRRGYAGLVMKALAKEIAETEICPMATVLKTNVPCNNLCEKLGFKKIINGAFIITNKRIK